MPVTFQIPNHIILPFGSPKWDISKISISAISPSGTYFTSDTKCAYIDSTKKDPLRLYQFRDLMPYDYKTFPEIKDPKEALNFICGFLKRNCELQTESEKLFVDIYFKWIIEDLIRYKTEGYSPKKGGIDPQWSFWALMPLPQTHIYCKDPFEDIWIGPNYQPDRMKRVDFAFWTGTQLVAIEIDGGSHIGSVDHIEKDRLLQRAGVHVIHILNEELRKHGTTIIGALLPEEICKPFGDPFRFLMTNKIDDFTRPYICQNPFFID